MGPGLRERENLRRVSAIEENVIRSTPTRQVVNGKA